MKRYQRKLLTLFGIPLRLWKRSLDEPKPISDRLLSELPQIGTTLLIKGNKLDNVDPELLRELGTLLVGIARGERADLLFRQNERTKPLRKNELHIAFVYHYMRACCGNLADDSEAIAQVRAAEPLDAPKAHATIKRIAQKYREEVFAIFGRKSRAELGEIVIGLTATSEQLQSVGCAALGHGSESQRLEGERILNHWKNYELTPEKVSAWREYLRRKSPRPDMSSVDG